MTKINTSNNSSIECNEFNINDWIAIYKTDQQAFEDKRNKWIMETIAAASPKNQQRLRGLQFQIDSQCKLSKNSYSTCIKISTMMLDKLSFLKEALSGNINNINNSSAKILNFSCATEKL